MEGWDAGPTAPGEAYIGSLCTRGFSVHGEPSPAWAETRHPAGPGLSYPPRSRTRQGKLIGRIRKLILRGETVKLEDAALCVEDLDGQLAAVFAGHGALDAFYSNLESRLPVLSNCSALQSSAPMILHRACRCARSKRSHLRPETVPSSSRRRRGSP